MTEVIPIAPFMSNVTEAVRPSVTSRLLARVSPANVWQATQQAVARNPQAACLVAGVAAGVAVTVGAYYVTPYVVKGSKTAFGWTVDKTGNLVHRLKSKPDDKKPDDNSGEAKAA